jgi:hypothetical protein
MKDHCPVYRAFRTQERVLGGEETFAASLDSYELLYPSSRIQGPCDEGRDWESLPTAVSIIPSKLTRLFGRAVRGFRDPACFGGLIPRSPKSKIGSLVERAV